MSQPVQIFIAYSRRDSELLSELRVHFTPLERSGKVRIWYDGLIEPGAVWEADIKKHLHGADIILLLVSADAIASDYFYDKEVSDALARHEKGEARVVPLIMRPCTWRATPLSGLQALPKEGKPVTTWADRDEAYTDAVTKIWEYTEGIAAKQRTSVKSEELAPKAPQARPAPKPSTAAPQDDHHTGAKVAVSPPPKKDPPAISTPPANPAPAKPALPAAIAQLEADMVNIEGGTFVMGCAGKYDWDCPSREKPLHTVHVATFILGRYPVTQAQWRAVMGNNPSSFQNCENCPVEMTSWNDIQEFLQKLNALTGKKYRLPSEAEWEYAARGGAQSRGYLYSGSNNPDEVAWHRDNSGEKTHPVGRKKPNELGLYDMSGNVWEFCSDDWHDTYEGAPADSRSWVECPRDRSRVIRGGCYFDFYDDSLCSKRYYSFPNGWSHHEGFRLARD